MAAQDLAPSIRVNGIYVGSIMTSALEMVAGDPNLMGQLEGKTPLGRVGEPADIAAGRVRQVGDTTPTLLAYWLIAPLPQWRQKKVKALVEALTA